jgi:hypothetical protein
MYRRCLVAVCMSALLVAGDAFQLPTSTAGAFSACRGRLSPIAPQRRAPLVVPARPAGMGPRMSSDAAGEKYVEKAKPVLDMVNFPADMKRLSMEQLKQLAYELRWEVEPAPAAPALAEYNATPVCR